MTKRAIDVTGAVILILVTLPLLVVAAVGAGISLRAWPFFSQQRVGRGGRLFLFPKIRTLPPSAPKYADKYALARVSVPPFTQYLRNTKLDELPQLFLVLSGRMSLVGPRPEMPNLRQQFDDDFAAVREALLPGCTGLWQISDRCAGLIMEATEFDEFYARNRTVRLDLWVLLRTARMLVPIGSARWIDLSTIPAWTLRRWNPETGVPIERRERATRNMAA